MDTINTSNIDTNSVDKKKKSIFTKCIIAFTSIFSLIGVGFALLIPSTYKSARAVSYDDESYTITLSADELNNYSFTNFGTLVQTAIFGDYSTFSYEGMTFTSQSYFNSSSSNGNLILKICETYPGSFSYPLISFNYLEVNYKFIYSTSSSVTSPFEHSFTFGLREGVYSAYKSAIEQDIAENQPNYTPTNLLQDMITLIFGGVLGVATGIGGGLSDLTNALVIQSGAMSPFIAIVFIFGGLALAFCLSRWVVNLITSLGNRNR